MEFLSRALSALPQAATSPLALLAYLATIAAWIWSVHRTWQLRILLDRAKHVPKSELAELIAKTIGGPIPKNISAENWIRSQKHRYFLTAFLALCFVILALAALASWTASDINHKERAARTEWEKTANQLRDRISKLQSDLQRLNGVAQGLTSRVQDARARALEMAIDSPERAQLKELADQLEVAVKEFVQIQGNQPLSNADSRRILLAGSTVDNARGLYKKTLESISSEDVTKQLREAKQKSFEAKQNSDEAVKLGIVRADALFGSRNWKEARRAFQQILCFSPTNEDAASGIATCAYWLDDLDSAVREFKPIVETYRKRYRESGGKEVALALAANLTNEGLALHGQGKLSEAYAAHNESVDIQSALVTDRPCDECLHGLAVALTNRGNVLLNQGRIAEATADYDESLKHFKALVNDRGHKELAVELAGSLTNRGGTYRLEGRTTIAIQCFTESITILDDLVGRLGHKEFAVDLATSLNNRGLAYRYQKNMKSAIDDVTRAISLCDDSMREGHDELTRQLAASLSNRSIINAMEKKAAQSLDDADRAILLLTPLVDKKGRKEFSGQLAGLQKNRGLVLELGGRLDDAIAEYGKAVDRLAPLVESEGHSELAPELVACLERRIAGCKQKGQIDQAISDEMHANYVRGRFLSQ
jgi:tetratricopeptide (TPR) repeat protein